MRGLLVTTLALLVASLAGCASTPEAATEAVAAAGLSVAVPEWVVGQHWSYRTVGGDGTTGAISLVVTGSNGGDWIVDTNDAQMAYFDDVFDVSYVGKISKAHLAGDQGGTRIKFFEFPLVADKTWTTTWDGVSQEVTVKELKSNGNAVLMAHNAAGDMMAEYEFSAQAGFFESITFYDANGTAMYSMERTGHGTGYVGSALRYDIQEPVVIRVDPSSTFQGTEAFGNANEIRILLHAFCNGDTQGRVLMGLGPKPADEAVHIPPIPMVMEPEYGMNHDCATGSVMVDDVGLIRIEPGEQWNIDVLTAGQNASGLIVIEPRILEILSGPFA